jgi:hypothetical protein
MFQRGIKPRAESYPEGFDAQRKFVQRGLMNLNDFLKYLDGCQAPWKLLFGASDSADLIRGV